MIGCLIVLVALAFSPPDFEPPPKGLTEAVQGYWQALEKHDKVTAMQFVYPEDLNNFLNRQDADLKNSSCVDIKLLDPKTAKVTVSFDRSIFQTYLKTETVETWIETDQGWKVRVDRPASVTEKIHRAVDKMPRPPLPARLDVLPERLPFYAISPQQLSTLRIRNGLDLPAEVLDLEYDKSMLTVAESVKTVPSHSTGRITFRYSGPKLTAENVEGRITLTIRQGSETRAFEIPVVYNYMNDLEHWFNRQRKATPQPPPK